MQQAINAALQSRRCNAEAKAWQCNAMRCNCKCCGGRGFWNKHRIIAMHTASSSILQRDANELQVDSLDHRSLQVEVCDAGGGKGRAKEREWPQATNGRDHTNGKASAVEQIIGLKVSNSYP
jgi:hypothetical protein